MAFYTKILVKNKCKVCDSEGELLSDGKTHMKTNELVDNADCNDRHRCC